MSHLAKDNRAAQAGPDRARHCPICGKPRSDAFRPFCSKRCADVDLGRWLGDRYAIPVDSDDENAGSPREDGC